MSSKTGRESTRPFAQPFVMYRPAKDGMKPPRVGQGNLLYPAHRLKCTFIQKHPPRHTQRQGLNKHLSTPWPREADTYHELSQVSSAEAFSVTTFPIRREASCSEEKTCSCHTEKPTTKDRERALDAHRA